jgi:hypothetical protein
LKKGFRLLLEEFYYGYKNENLPSVASVYRVPGRISGTHAKSSVARSANMEPWSRLETTHKNKITIPFPPFSVEHNFVQRAYSTYIQGQCPQYQNKIVE